MRTPLQEALAIGVVLNTEGDKRLEMRCQEACRHAWHIRADFCQRTTVPQDDVSGRHHLISRLHLRPNGEGSDPLLTFSKLPLDVFRLMSEEFDVCAHCADQCLS